MTHEEQYTNDKLNKNIDYYQIKEGITQKELQERLGVGKVYLSRLKAKGSTQQPGIQVVRKLSMLMGVSMETLVYGEVQTIEERLEEKQREFINKVIEDTQSATLKWQEFKMYVNSENKERYDLYYQPDVDESVWIFESMYGRTYINSVSNKSSGYRVILDTSVELILVELLYKREEEHAYELYIAQNGKCIKGCTNESIEDEAFKMLKTLWKSITIDAEKMTLYEIYDNYLKLDKTKE